MKGRIIEETDRYVITVDEDGVKKKTIIATPGQMSYIHSLQKELGKPLTQGKPALFVAKKMIDSLLKQKRERGL